MIESIREELGEVPEEVLADGGYNTPDVLEELEKKQKGIRIYTSQGKTSRNIPSCMWILTQPL